MPHTTDYATIRMLIDDAKANHDQKGFEEPRLILDALNMLTDAVEQMEQKRAKTESNIAKRLGTMIAVGLTSDFVKDAILNGEPNYPYGKDDPDQLEFDKMVDDALREALRK